jgi:hypothetical protein
VYVAAALLLVVATRGRLGVTTRQR